MRCFQGGFFFKKFMMFRYGMFRDHRFGADVLLYDRFNSRLFQFAVSLMDISDSLALKIKENFLVRLKCFVIIKCY